MDRATRVDSVLKNAHPFTHPRTCFEYSNCIFLQKYCSCNQGVGLRHLPRKQKVSCSSHAGRTTKPYNLRYLESIPALPPSLTRRATMAAAQVGLSKLRRNSALPIC